jgi:hypothetical protein
MDLIKFMKKISFVGLLLVFVCSCKDEGIQKNTKKNKIDFIFPDTVFANNAYSGKIIYSSDLDTITTKLFDKNNFRTIEYQYTGTKMINYDINHLKTKIKDTVYAKNNNLIEMKKIWFGKIGTFYFDGVIKDEVKIISRVKDNNGKYKIRLITNELRLSKKIVVISR